MLVFIPLPLQMGKLKPGSIMYLLVSSVNLLVTTGALLINTNPFDKSTNKLQSLILCSDTLCLGDTPRVTEPCDATQA